MEDICTFISQLKGDSVHPPGPQRCETMRKYYQELIESRTQQAGSSSSYDSSRKRSAPRSSRPSPRFHGVIGISA